MQYKLLWLGSNSKPSNTLTEDRIEYFEVNADTPATIGDTYYVLAYMDG